MPVPMSPACSQPGCCDSLHFQLANSGSFSVARYFGYWTHSYFTRRIWQNVFSFLSFTPCNRNGRCNSHISWPGQSRARLGRGCGVGSGGGGQVPSRQRWRLIGPFYGIVSFEISCLRKIILLLHFILPIVKLLKFLGNIFTFCCANCATCNNAFTKLMKDPRANHGVGAADPTSGSCDRC